MKALTKELFILNEGLIQFPILPNGPGWKSTEKKELPIIESGEEGVFLSKILTAIKQSKEMICLQSFLIQDTEVISALLNAVERHVRVFVLSSVEARLKETIEEEQSFIKLEYIQLLDKKFKNHFIHRSAKNFHAKYILIDPRTNPIGFICTNNFTENGFTKNPELAMQLTIKQCTELYKIFVYHFWEHASDEQTSSTEFTKVRPAGKFSLPKMESVLLTSPNEKNNTLAASLLDAVKNAKKSISLSTFQLDKSEEIVKQIIVKAQDGIAVTIFCRPVEILLNEQLKPLLTAGAEIFFHPLMHAKSLLIDESIGYLFTANLMRDGLLNGFEVGVKLSLVQAEALCKIYHCWRSLFPMKVLRQAAIQEISQHYIFKNGKLTNKVLINDHRDRKQRINSVADLCRFFEQQPSINDHSIKSIALKLVAEINVTQDNYRPIGKYEIVEKGHNEKWVIINEEFNPADIELLSPYKEAKIFYANRHSILSNSLNK